MSSTISNPVAEVTRYFTSSHKASVLPRYKLMSEVVQSIGKDTEFTFYHKFRTSSAVTPADISQWFFSI